MFLQLYFKGIFSDLQNEAFMSIDPLTATASKDIDRTTTPYLMFTMKYKVSIIYQTLSLIYH